jgi:hypothetical protein
MENLTKAQLIEAITNFINALFGAPFYEPPQREPPQRVNPPAYDMPPAYEPPQRVPQQFDLPTTLDFAAYMRDSIANLMRYKRPSNKSRELYNNVVIYKGMFKDLIKQLENNLDPNNLHYRVVHDIYDNYKKFINNNKYKIKYTTL